MVLISDNIKRNNMFAFANRPELLVAQLFLLVHSHQDVNKAYYFRSENQTEPPSLANRSSKNVSHSSVHWCYHWVCSCSKTSHGCCVGRGGNHPYSVRHRRAKSFGEYVIFQNGNISGIPNYKIITLNEWKL